MAALCENDTEDFVTCPICLNEFEENVRKPKFLPCCHTLCLQCLKGIHINGQLTCPLCRKVCQHTDDVSSLPNNPYALHMLKLKAGRVKKPDIEQQSSPVLTSTIKDFEVLLSLKDELCEIKEEWRSNLSLAVAKRDRLGQHLELLEKSLKEIHADIINLQEQNNAQLIEMKAQLEDDEVRKSKQQGNPSSLSDLVALVGDSEPGDTVSTLREKMKKSFDACKKQLEETEVLERHYLDLPKLSVKLGGDPVVISKFLPLLSFITLTDLETQKNPCPTRAKKSLPSSSTSAPSSLSASATANRESQEVAAELAPPTFVASRSTVFVLTIKQSGIIKGEVHIKLNVNFAPNFVQELGKFCFQTPKTFARTVTKAIPGIYTTIPMWNKGFRPVASELTASTSQDPALANHNADVGIIIDSIDGSSGRVEDWSLLFPLNFFNAPESYKHVKFLPPAQLFGHVSKGMNMIVMLTRLSKYELKNEFTFTLECR